MAHKSIGLCAVLAFFIQGGGSPLAAQDEITSGIEEFHYRPAMSLYYGFTDNSIRDFGSSFARPRMAELKMGETTEEGEFRAENILRYRYRYGFLSAISNDLGNKSTSGEINTELWRLGAAWDKGYGYALGKSAIIPYSSYGLHWSRLNVKDKVASGDADSSLLASYDGPIRFGTKMEGGVRIQLIRLVSVDAAYERAIVFPGHLFWKWLGSTLIELGGQELLDRFIQRVLDSSPGAAPVLSFVLKNGLSYGMYELRKEKMNYPFDSNPALMNDTFKIGLTFIF